jgi:hypothetical protein
MQACIEDVCMFLVGEMGGGRTMPGMSVSCKGKKWAGREPVQGKTLRSLTVTKTKEGSSAENRSHSPGML